MCTSSPKVKRYRKNTSCADKSQVQLRHSDGKVRICGKNMEACFNSAFYLRKKLVAVVFSSHALCRYEQMKTVETPETTRLIIAADHVHPFMIRVNTSARHYFERIFLVSKSIDECMRLLTHSGI